jgi:hypothetical protein
MNSDIIFHRDVGIIMRKSFIRRIREKYIESK